MPQRCLPDVNVWVALLDEAHVFHAQALAFIQRKRPLGTPPSNASTKKTIRQNPRHKPE